MAKAVVRFKLSVSNHNYLNFIKKIIKGGKMMKGLMKRIGGCELSFTKKLHRGQKGFTLMELLIVVAILGVLAAVVIPRFTGLIGRGEEEAAATELEVVQTAIVAAMTATPVANVTAGGPEVLGPTTIYPIGAPVADYLQTTTDWAYTWDDIGTITDQTIPAP